MTAEACLDCGGRLKALLCGLEDSRFGAPGSYDIAVCATRGMEQAVPRPSADELTALYEAAIAEASRCRPASP